MKQFFIHISLVLTLLVAGCTEVETESPVTAKENPATQSATEKDAPDKITPEVNDPVKKQHLSGADTAISEENSETKPHVSGSTTPTQSTHISGQ